MDISKIIGTKNPDGTRVLPELNIYGKPYPRGGANTFTTIGVAPGKFVVVPPKFEDGERLEAVKAALNPPAQEVFNIKRRGEVPNAGE